MDSMKTEIEKINNLLIEEFGIPPRSKKLPDPLDLLIATILSQNTNDKNSYRAYENLKEKYPDWSDIIDSDLKEIENTIKIAGLGKQKSAAIKNLVSNLSEKNKKLSLDHLADEANNKILEELTGLKGIGLKTASCVLLFAMDRNVCPVDTHVHRTLNRIGLVKTSAPDKTFEIINPEMPEGIAHQFHTNLIRLGREICKSQKPGCGICPLEKICKFDDKNYSSNVLRKTNDFLLLDKIGDFESGRSEK